MTLKPRFFASPSAWRTWLEEHHAGTPRKPRSVWSAVNVKRATELSNTGLMRPAGLAAFQKRDEKRSEIYSYEQRRLAKLPAAYESKFRINPDAWAFFHAQPPGYQRICSWWVISAKKEETRLRRLAALIEHSQHRRKIPVLSRPRLKRAMQIPAV